ncbi:MAG: DNA mismatch repair endonuclease MutL [Bacteroidales bacterium]|nr:DNA mismatch repair endonuclease MutL [Bacteroidales bacterium]
MPDIIKLLPDSVANQIAAGEVIQRPASALKELLENSIDSGADNIKIIIKDAGKTLIQVIDNGCGMSETDARLSFERHATSKIQTAKDLFSIRTLGFRGEALASIAAIAQVEMKTKRIEDELGTKIIVEGSKTVDQENCSCSSGTSISIKNLFFNVPARRNFLKSTTAETRHIIEEFFRVALINCDISFSLFNNSREVFRVPNSTQKLRIVGLYGKNYNERLIPVDQKTNFVSISGFIGKPEFSKKTRGEQYFFVNKRFIKHSYLHHAVVNALMELLPHDSFPSYFLNIEVPTDSIDINIHPTKTEISFQDNQQIYAVIRSAIRQSLGKFSISPTIDFEVEKSFDIPPLKEGEIPKFPEPKINPDYNPFQTKNQDLPSEISIRQESNRQNWEELYKQNLSDSYKENGDNPNQNVEHTLINPDWGSEETEIEKYTPFQLQNKYILSKVKSGILVIEQQRAHEKILFERYLNMLESQNGASQQQLFPEQIDFSPADSEIIDEIKNDLYFLGFDLSKFGQNTYVVNGIPADACGKNINDLLEKIIESYKSGMIDISLNKKINLARSMAVNMAVKAGKKLETEEMLRMIDELFACKLPNISLQGRPTLKIFSIEEIEKGFN